MFDTLTLKKLWVPVLALGLGGFAGVGCVDNSGNKTYPHADAADDVSATDGGSDAGTDAPASDGPAGDIHPVVDAPAGDVPASDVAVDRAPVDTLPGDALATDVRTDVTGN